MTLIDLIKMHSKIGTCAWFHSMDKNSITIRNSAGSCKSYTIDLSIIDRYWSVKINKCSFEIKDSRFSIEFYSRWYEIFDLRTCIKLHVPYTIKCKDLLKAFEDQTMVDIKDYNLKYDNGKWFGRTTTRIQFFKEPFSFIPKKILDILKIDLVK